MKNLWLLAGFCVLAGAQGRPPEIPFAIRMVDGGASETAAFADLNNDRRLDIVSSDAWHASAGVDQTQDPRRSTGTASTSTTSAICRSTWTATATSTSSSSRYFANNIVWMKNPGKAGGAWTSTEIDTGFPPSSRSSSISTTMARRASCCPSSIAPRRRSPGSISRVASGLRHVVSDHQLRARHRRG